MPDTTPTSKIIVRVAIDRGDGEEVILERAIDLDRAEIRTSQDSDGDEWMLILRQRPTETKLPEVTWEWLSQPGDIKWTPSSEEPPPYRSHWLTVGVEEPCAICGMEARGTRPLKVAVSFHDQPHRIVPAGAHLCPWCQHHGQPTLKTLSRSSR